MKILIYGRLNRKGTELAQALHGAGHDIFVMHPDRYPLEFPFPEAMRDIHALTSADLTGVDAVLCMPESSEADHIGILAERILESDNTLPLVLLEERPLCSGFFPRISAAASLLTAYTQEYHLNGCLLSVPALYGNTFLPEMLERAAACCIRTNTLSFDGSPDMVCSMLHAEDAAALILHVLSSSASPAPRVSVPSGQEFLLEQAGNIFQRFYPQSECTWSANAHSAGPDQRSSTQFPDGWTPRHHAMEELPDVLQDVDALFRHQSAMRSVKRRNLFFRAITFLLVFAAVWAYAHFTHTHSPLQFVDLRLLFVISASVIMGRNWGIAAALLAGASGITDQLLAGTAWHVLFFRPSNWIPFAVYLACAILFGMYREQHLNAERTEDLYGG